MSQLHKVNIAAIEGLVIPDTTIHRFDGSFTQINSRELFENKRVIIFSPIGAYTPTCSEQHLPRYEELYRTFKQAGIQEVYCVAVNDAFVMNSWAERLRIKHVKMIPDGNGDLCRNLGCLVDRSDVGFGLRSYRFAMVVDNNRIEKVFVEAEDFGFTSTDADSLLNYVSPSVSAPPRVAILTKAGCAACEKTKSLLTAKKLTFVELPLPDHSRPIAVGAITGGSASVPQVFVDGKLIGGSEAVELWLSSEQH